MENEIERGLIDLLAQGRRIAKGATDNAATIALGNNTAANINLDIAALEAAIAAHKAGRTELSNRRKNTRKWWSEGRKFLTKARDSFKPELGYSHNLSWEETGLVRSLRIPEKESSVLELLASFKGFLTAKPAMEKPADQITATITDGLFDNLDNAIGAVDAQETVVRQLKLNRDAAEGELRSRLRGTIGTLRQELDSLDPRWSSFGLNLPGLKQKPEAPENVTLAKNGAGAALARWKKARRAEYYRIWLRIVGTDETAQAVGTRSELDYILANLPTGSVIEVAVSAVNNGGESDRSAVATLTVE